MKKWEPSFPDEQDGGRAGTETMYHKMSEIQDDHYFELLRVAIDSDGSDSVLLEIFWMGEGAMGSGGARVWLTPPEIEQLISALKDARDKRLTPA